MREYQKENNNYEIISKYINKDEFINKASAYEGYLFPDTYMFDERATSDEVINVMNETFKKKIDEKGNIRGNLE
jgi:cell division protein YceG involved in septum cleavage